MKLMFHLLYQTVHILDCKTAFFKEIFPQVTAMGFELTNDSVRL